ncbi:hypothetical protein GCM10023215_61010 [Pseudonocardia yuanmonensis]|uniref:Uncharacterized protein n=1 Tax=Pseudonocardia yuanmonensis TaxID=1095914 RepID=A0ABP8XP70_9PSEU
MKTSRNSRTIAERTSPTHIPLILVRPAPVRVVRGGVAGRSPGTATVVSASGAADGTTDAVSLSSDDPVPFVRTCSSLMTSPHTLRARAARLREVSRSADRFARIPGSPVQAHPQRAGRRIGRWATPSQS